MWQLLLFIFRICNNSARIVFQYKIAFGFALCLNRSAWLFAEREIWDLADLSRMGRVHQVTHLVLFFTEVAVVVVQSIQLLRHIISPRAVQFISPPYLYLLTGLTGPDYLPQFWLAWESIWPPAGGFICLPLWNKGIQFRDSLDDFINFLIRISSAYRQTLFIPGIAILWYLNGLST